MQASDEKRFTTCTTSGPLFAHVKEGRIIRVEPMHFDADEVLPWKVEVNGKTYTPPLKYPLLYWAHTARKWVYSENRVKYPMKRVDWDPNGERHPENRGKSGYVRISWEEAFDLLVAELARVRQTYGPSAVLTGFSAHPEWGSMHYFFSDHFRFWHMLGSTSREITPISWEGWTAGAAFMYGYFRGQGILPAQDTFQDISKDSDLIVLWGLDPITHNIYNGIDTPRAFKFWRELGKKVILIDPLYNDTGTAYADKWIPIIPGTDAAMGAAIAYIWIQEGAYDQEYLNTHTIGFDEEHMPEGVPAGLSFKNYILGLKDGVAKTPEWAEKITSVPSRVIRELAHEWASKPTSLWAMYGGACRRAFAHEMARMMVTLQAMQGLGKPGVNLIGGILNLSAQYDQRQLGPTGYADGGINAVSEAYYPNQVPQVINSLLLKDAIENPPLKWKGGMFMMDSPQAFVTEHEYPMEGCSEVHMIWHRGSTQVNNPDRNRDVAVYQNPKIETMVVQAPWFDRDCRYADLVLPTTTNFERQDLTEPGSVGQYIPPAWIGLRSAVFHQRCIDPVGESKTDLEIYSELAQRLGLGQEYTEGNTEEDWLKKLYAKTNIPMTYDEFKEKGYYVWPALPDYKPCKQMEEFYQDPENNKLDTPSGKIEIFSQWLYKFYGADNPEIPPVPHYIPEWEGRYTEELIDKYPLQLLQAHPKYRFHGKFNDVSWLAENYKIKGSDGYPYEPIYMRPEDAEARGLVDGDIARVFNDRGQVLAGVVLTERLVPGVAWLTYGSWNDPLEPEPGALDRAGDANNLTPARRMSIHHAGIASNTTLVEVEKADLEALAAAYPDGWAGKYRTWNKE
ncbi:MAG: molybdopterin-dependent oxidoreductase [Anaerolineales bacterium]|nr:molybdopterin-dependent oxidoreductase [Anaerolineales bacterium]